MRAWIYYHNDLDGYASAAIMYLGLTRRCNFNPSVDWIFFRCIQYGDPFDPKEEIDYEKDQVCLVDFKLPDDEMLELLAKANLIWIDHHKSSEDFIEKYEVDLNGDHKLDLRIDTSKAACELVWEYCFDQKIPLAIKLLGAYDMWKKKEQHLSWEDQILPFQIQMKHILEKIEPSKGNMDWWKWLLSCNYYLEDSELHLDVLECQHEFKVHDLIEAGQKLISFQGSMYREMLDSSAYQANFLGKYKAICLNSPIANSRIFEAAYDVSQWDLMIVYTTNGQNWRVSLYTVHDHISCNEIATRLGQEGPFKSGGGHPKAAGFITSFEYLASYIQDVRPL